MPIVNTPSDDTDVGCTAPDILIPHTSVDHRKWAVIACDQYTSDPEYWDTIESIVGDNPSTLRLIIPEAHLPRVDEERAAEEIELWMRRYIEDGTLVSLPSCPVLVRRHPASGRGPIRNGLMTTLDLEHYDYRPGSASLIRATEKTIVERLPARMAVRRNVPLEVPHILVFIDDPAGTVIEPLVADRDSRAPDSGSTTAGGSAPSPLYDFDLMAGGGHISGYRVSPTEWKRVLSALDGLIEGRPEGGSSMRGSGGASGALFAVGDGNHSLAAAKAVWEEKKAAGASSNHPARWAMVEVCNIYDPAIVLHPIHRVLFDVDPQECIRFLTKSRHLSFRRLPPERLEVEIESSGDAHTVGLIAGSISGVLSHSSPSQPTVCGTVQPPIDDFLQTCPAARIDYIHEAAQVRRLGLNADTVGLIFPVIEKRQIFSVIEQNTVFPRKTFSIGTSTEKRYYLECRRIQPSPEYIS
jgi:hypothetical protein